jgi:hypothetical protein
LQRNALATQAQVVCEQFLERKSLLRRMRPRQQCADIGIARWAVHDQQRITQRRQSERIQQPTRQQFEGRLVWKPIQRLPDQAPQADRADSIDRRINRI